MVATNPSLLSADARVQRSIRLRTLKNNVQQLLAEELPLLRAELDHLCQDVIVVIAHSSELNAASATPQPAVSNKVTENQPKPNSTSSRWLAQSRRFLVTFAPDKLLARSHKVQKNLVQADHSPWKGQIVTVVETEAEITARQEGKLQLRDLPLLARYVRTYWSPYAITGIIGGAGLMSFSAYQLYYAQTLRLITDSAIKAGGVAAIQGGLLKLAIGLPVSIGASLIGERLSARLSSRVANDIRYDLFDHLQDLSPSFHKEAKLGDLLARFSTDMEKIEEAMGRELVAGIGDAIMLAVSMWVMLSIQWQLTAISLLPIIVMRRPVLWAADNFAKTGFEMQGQKALMVNAAQEGLRALPFTKSFGLQKFMLSSFGDELKKLEDKNTEGLFGRGLFQNTVISSYQLLKITTLTASILYVATGAISFGSALAFMMVAENFYFNYSQLTSHRLTKWIDAGVGTRRLDELFRYPATLVESKYAVSMPPFRNALRFENVSFGYGHDPIPGSTGSNGNGHNGVKHHLQEINLTIEAGQFVAFVGPSGAGKSTIFNLLMRFYDVSDGSITIDGYNLRDVTQASLCAQIGVVLQETFLFNTTIYDNICLVKPEASEEEVIAAAKAAELHNFILSLPDGYQTVVGEGGGRLSGGQRQRIAIARALLHDPAILLLDEATSSLDSETATAINATLQKLARHRTVIMITHQLPSVVEADKIFVLKAGQLVEQGRHEELLALDGVYHKLWQSQSTQTGSPPRNSHQSSVRSPDL